ncbi:MAG: hypothetical protein QW331_03520 [Candidatus Woesearchaeota archaeon]
MDEKIVSELKQIGLIFVGMIIVFQIVFYNENILTNIRTVFAFFWLFIMPGYFIMLRWHEDIDFLLRFGIGTALGFSLMGILSYYLAMLGLNFYIQSIVLPIALSIGGFLIYRKN